MFSILAQGLLRMGEEATCLHMEVGGGFSFTREDFTKIILIRATVVRPKSGENK